MPNERVSYLEKRPRHLCMPSAKSRRLLLDRGHRNRPNVRAANEKPATRRSVVLSLRHDRQRRGNLYPQNLTVFERLVMGGGKAA
jgi:hypothetical protein